MLKHFSEYTDMSKEAFMDCLKKVDQAQLLQDPTKALKNAGITLKKGVTCQFVESDDEVNALPSNVIPLKKTGASQKPLSEEQLDKVAGGSLLQGTVNWEAVGIGAAAGSVVPVVGTAVGFFVGLFC